jgi:fructose-1,6-bisphosphatase/inositol monophosphatase family enzyme
MRTSPSRNWIIDPIDGTLYFANRIPLFANLIAYEDEHGPAIGVINNGVLLRKTATAVTIGGPMSVYRGRMRARRFRLGKNRETSGNFHRPPAAPAMAALLRHENSGQVFSSAWASPASA